MAARRARIFEDGGSDVPPATVPIYTRGAIPREGGMAPSDETADSYPLILATLAKLVMRVEVLERQPRSSGLMQRLMRTKFILAAAGFLAGIAGAVSGYLSPAWGAALSAVSVGVYGLGQAFVDGQEVKATAPSAPTASVKIDQGA